MRFVRLFSAPVSPGGNTSRRPNPAQQHERGAPGADSGELHQAIECFWRRQSLDVVCLHGTAGDRLGNRVQRNSLPAAQTAGLERRYPAIGYGFGAWEEKLIAAFEFIHLAEATYQL